MILFFYKSVNRDTIAIILGTCMVGYTSGQKVFKGQVKHCGIYQKFRYDRHPQKLKIREVSIS